MIKLRMRTSDVYISKIKNAFFKKLYNNIFSMNTRLSVHANCFSY